jgi:cation:H+ antiporter
MSVLTVVTLLSGLVLLAAGGEILVRGATQLASAFGLSSFIVGLTVVSFATSAPELAVTMQATFDGNPGLAVGNVVGSNIANVLLILGVCALIVPLAVKSQLVRVDIPVLVVLSVLLLVLALDHEIGRLDGALLLAALVVYTTAVILLGRRRHWDEPAARAPEGTERPTPETEAMPLRAAGLIAIGVVMLVGGANLLVSGATEIAAAIGVSDLVIGLSVVAIGTSLPELAASVVAIMRGERDLAVGNIVGSGLFNIGAVLGLSAVIAPDVIPVPDAAVRLDIPIMIAVALALAPVAFTGFAVVRWEGALFVALYAAYIAYVLLDATGHDAVGPFSAVMLGFVIPITALWLVLLVAYEVGLRRGRLEAGL